MLVSTLSRVAAAVLLLVVFCLSAASTAGQTLCSGAAVSVGPAVTPSSFSLYGSTPQLYASRRNVTTTTQVTSLSMNLVYYAQTANTQPIQLSYALYGPPTCGSMGESALLATTAIYTVPATRTTRPRASRWC